MIMKKTENKAMTKRSIFRCLIAALCLVAITGCSEKNGSDAGVEPTSSHITAAVTTDTTETATSNSTAETTTTTTITAVTTTTTATETTVEITTVTEIRLKELDRIADSLDEPSELTSPFGDISDAYVCFGGTALFPSVRVLSADEVKKLSKILNSMEWEEFPDKPETPATPGPNDLTLYINDNGKRSQLGLLGDTYCDENGYRYFRTRSPENVEENISLHQICSDLLFDSDLENVSTHLSRFLEISQPDGSYDINEYWDLIWDDVMQYINDEATQDDNIE